MGKITSLAVKNMELNIQANLYLSVYLPQIYFLGAFDFQMPNK